MASGWAPDQGKLDQVGQLLTACVDVSNHAAHRQALEMLEQGKANYPDFGCYLLVVFCKMPTAGEHLRHLAGLQLKNAIRDRHMKEPELSFVRAEITSALADPAPQFRRTAAQIVTSICGRYDIPARVPNNTPVQDWDGLLPGLLQMLESGVETQVEGAFCTLRLLFEDHADQLNQTGLADALQALVAKFISFFQHSSSSVRASAIYCIRMLILPMPNALVVALQAFLQGLLALSKDPAAEVRKEICTALCLLAECKADFLSDPQICSFVIEFLLWTTEHDSDYDVKKAACEFWQTLCENQEIPPNVLQPYLSRLTLVLLNGMVYSEDEIIALEEEEEKNSQQDVNPALMHGSSRGTIQDEEEDEDDEEGGGVEWTLRKCSALGLDVIATHYKQEILDALLPHIHQKLQVADWKVQESAVLAMGALQEGCEEGLIARNYLNDFIKHLITGVLPSQQPFLRSITCWTLSRYANYVSRQSQVPEHGQNQLLEPMVSSILNCMMDRSAKVQEAAVSAMAVLEEEARTLLVPYVPAILNVYSQALQHYKTKNLVILYDACGTLAEALGDELNKPEYINVLLPPLIVKWNAVPDDDKSLLPLLECMSYLVSALKMGFEQFAQPVMQRCERIIARNLDVAEEMADEEFIVFSLDLLAGLAGGLEGSMEALMASTNSQCVPLMLRCLTHHVPDVRQSAFALLGDLAKSAPTHLHPHLQPILHAVLQNLDPDFLSVCNNACWSVGELAVRSPPASEAISHLVVPLVNILCRPRLHRSLLENAAITLGRFGLVCPESVAPNLQNFIKPWCNVLVTIRDDVEKEQALRGIVKMSYMTPAVLVDAWPSVCEAIHSWKKDTHPMPPELERELTDMLGWFKSNLQGAGQWDACHSMVSAEAKHGLQINFGLA